MSITFDRDRHTGGPITLKRMETYVGFRSVIPKPTHEEAHLRHILRFYVARFFAKEGYGDVFILPTFDLNGTDFVPDVCALGKDKIMLAVCETSSVTDQTAALLDRLKDEDGIEVIIIYSQYGKDSGIVGRFQPQFDSQKFHLVAVVPPPFDDVYEYDIWMFETTFRNVLMEK